VPISVDRSDAALSGVSEDFGHVVHGDPFGVITPTSGDEVIEAVHAAISSGWYLTLRGNGHSAGGQAVPRGSIVVDLSRLDRVGPVDTEKMTIRCGAGATLRQLVGATLPSGLLPRPLTNLLDLSVGGLLGVGGGVGPSSHLYGAIAANVVELDVVTGDGVLHRCSRMVEPELLGAAIGGLGVCGVIVSAQLRLRRIRPHVRTFYLLYDDHRRWLDDQRLLADAGVDALEGFCSAAPQGLRGLRGHRSGFAHWFFPLHVAIEFDGSPPELPDEVAPYRILATEDDAIEFFPARHDARFEMMRRTGAWEQAHPYVSAFVDRHALAEVLPDVLDALPPSLGDGYRGGFLFDRREAPPLLALPRSDDVAFFSVMYPQIPRDAVKDALDVHAQVSDLFVKAGATRYKADWLGEVDGLGWRSHFAGTVDDWRRARERFDPQGIFRSALVPAR